MANNRGSHSRPEQQGGAYQVPNIQQGRGQSPYQQAGYQQNAYNQRPNPGAGYQRPANGQYGGGYAPPSDASQYSHYNNRYGGAGKKRKHTARNVVIALLIVVILIGGFAGFTGYTLYNSAMSVKAEASEVMSNINDLKDQVLSENPEQANATANKIAKSAASMKDETSGWAWTVASFVPVYGGDVGKVRELSNVFDDLAKNAIVPLVGEVSQVSLKNLVVDGVINVDLANKLVSSLNSAAPIISRSYDKLEAMGSAQLEQINEPLETARSALSTLNSVTDFVADIAPSFADMLGANGRRTYLIVAQGNTEIRSTGGFYGSIGPMYIDNGRVEMGGFREVTSICPEDAYNIFAPLTDEEINIFGIHVSFQIADCGFIPDFSRAAEIVKYAWEAKDLGHVDGVIGMDPVFLQHMLAITGGIVTSDGTVVDGTNAGRILLHDVYYRPELEQDPFYEEVAAVAFGHIMSSLGSVSIVDFANAINDEMYHRRLQVWMEKPAEEQAIETLGGDGKLPHNAKEPVLGVYFAEESYSKMFWYFKYDVSVGEGTKNANGSTTYPVTVKYWNMIQDESELANYMRAHNGIARSPAEMITWVMLSAPQDGYISDMVCTEGEFMPEGTNYRLFGSPVTGTMTQATLQGLDFWFGLSRTLPGGTFALNFNVTTSPNATEPLRVVSTPSAQEVAGW